MSLGAYILITAAFAGALGFLIGWLLGRGRAPVAPADSRLENELRQQLAQREGELNQSRAEILQNKTALATAQANQSGAEKLLAEQRALHERAMAEAKTAQEKAIAELRDAFKAMSADALKQSAPETS